MKKLLSLALVLAVALIFWAVNCPAIVGASAAKRELPIYNVQRDNKAVSLTFDAAWGDVRDLYEETLCRPLWPT